MAEQRKRTAAKKKTTAAKKSTGRQTAAQKRLAEEQARSRRQLWAVILFAVGIFFLAVQGGKQTSILGSVRDTIYLTWADKTLSWRNNSSNSIECLLNLAGRQYCWLAMTIL